VGGRPAGQGPGGDAREMLVVGVGGDVGMYALVRAFHEEYGTRAIVLSKVATRAMQDSAIAENVVVPGIDEVDVFLSTLEGIAQQHRDKVLVLLTNADWHVRTVILNRERLEAAGYVTPYPSLPVLEQVSSKEGFAEVCDRLGIPTPRTVAVDVAKLVADGGRPAIAGLEVDLQFPVV